MRIYRDFTKPQPTHGFFRMLRYKPSPPIIASMLIFLTAPMATAQQAGERLSTDTLLWTRMTQDTSVWSSYLSESQEISTTDQQENSESSSPEFKKVEYSIHGGGAYQFDSDIDDGGEFSVARGGVVPAVTFNFDQRLSLTVKFSYLIDAYDFSGSGAFTSIRPWDNIHSLGLGADVRWHMNDQWTIYGGPTVKMSAESGANFDEALFGGGYLGFSYRFSDQLLIGPGIGLLSEIEGDVDVIPILFVDWEPITNVTLRTGRGLAATRGPGLELAWAFTEHWEAGIAGRFDKLRFRLDDTGTGSNGVGEDKSFTLAATLDYSPSPKMQLSLAAGVILGGQLRLEDSSGTRLANTDYDPVPFVGIATRLRF